MLIVQVHLYANVIINIDNISVLNMDFKNAHIYANFKVPNFVLESPMIGLYSSKVKKHFHFLIICIAAPPYFSESENGLFEVSVSPLFSEQTLL